MACCRGGKAVRPVEAATRARPVTGTVDDWPLWFVQHRFSSKCFSVQDCTISYAGRRVEKMSAGPLPSVESLGFPLEKILGGGHSGIMNFPPPAQVDWIAMDGTRMSATVDMAEIFKDRLLVHSTPGTRFSSTARSRRPISPWWWMTVRSMSTCGRRSLFKELRDHDNPHSNFRTEVVAGVFTDGMKLSRSGRIAMDQYRMSPDGVQARGLSKEELGLLQSTRAGIGAGSRPRFLESPNDGSSLSGWDGTGTAVQGSPEHHTVVARIGNP